jgi:signal transduction histidine kinase/ligand-binding sensor domain-containing protein
MRTLHSGLRLRLGLRVRGGRHESSLAVQNLDESRPVKPGKGSFLSFGTGSGKKHSIGCERTRWTATSRLGKAARTRRTPNFSRMRRFAKIDGLAVLQGRGHCVEWAAMSSLFRTARSIAHFSVVAMAVLLATVCRNDAQVIELAKAKEFLINSWDQADGLPSTRVNGVARTWDGYVWLATHGGLVRFDGDRFTTFTTNQISALHTNIVTSLRVDDVGTLWLGTADGSLVRSDTNGFSRIELPEIKWSGSHWFNSIAGDSASELWAAPFNAGLVRVKGGKAEVFGREFGATNVTQLLRDRDGRFWAVSDGRLLMRQEERWEEIGGIDAPEESVRVICEARNGGFWVATLASNQRGTRIFRYKDGNWGNELGAYPWPQGSVRSRAQTILEDSDGRLWCATAGGGVFFRSLEGDWQRLATGGALSQSDALCFMEDEAGVVWVGTRTSGLHQVRPRAVNALHLPSEANQNVVLTVCATSDGSIWAGTEGSGLFRWRGDQVTQYGAESGLDNLYVNALFEDSRKNLWVATVGGLFRFENGRFEPVTGSAALQTSVMSIYEDRRGGVWAGTRGGLVRFHKGEVDLFGGRDGLGGAPVRAMAEDGEGRLWVEIETAGLFRQNGERFELVPNVPNMLATGARAIHCDSDGALWFATRSSGLFRWKEGRIAEWTNERDGLPSDRHFGMLEDDEGNLWLSSESGVFGCARRTLNTYQRWNSPLLTPWRLTQSDGLAYKVCTGGGQPAASKGPDGMLWFGNGPAVVGFDPRTAPRGLRVWPPQIETLLVDGEGRNPDADGIVRIKSGVNGFEFQYTSPNILSPQRIRFRYQLSNVDKHWVDAGTRRSAFYTHLQPGRYKFNVQAASPDGEWYESAQPMSVFIVPRFFERLSVQMMGGVLLLAAVAGAAWRMERTRSMHRMERMRLQSAMELERQRIARDIHDDLGSGLTEIILLSDNLHDELPSSASAEKMVTEIGSRARALTRGMDEVVWAVNPRNDTLESLLTYFNKFSQEYLTHAGVRCRMDVPVELPHVPLSAQARHHLYLACKEAINNIVKHSRASEVWVRLQIEGEGFALGIEDNGHGFDAAEVARGNGLHNMRKRLEELGGRCDIESKPGGGTRVTFRVFSAVALNKS